jgi:predicted O-methyltransferase YrrM
MYLAAGCPGSVVYTMEGCPRTSGLAEENFRNGGFSNITLLNGSFNDMLPELKKKNVKPGLVFIDGNHKKEQVFNYFREVIGMSDYEVVIVFDDIHYSPGMEEAWDEISHDGNVTLSIDLYRLGLIFLRKGITRKSYTIRY